MTQAPRAGVGSELTVRVEDGRELYALVWRLTVPMLSISSAPLGGGVGLRRWILNAQVPSAYDCREPEAHLMSLASASGLSGPGIGMLTAVDVRRAVRVQEEGIAVEATVGLAHPLWAAAVKDITARDETSAAHAGTVNVVAFVPERLAEAALVNAVATATEAKAQALWEAGIAGTGTATDAICIMCPPEGEAHSYGGPRSLWGARLARAVHRAVSKGCEAQGVQTT